MFAPLSGVRVVEVASWVAVPSAAAIFADLGAEVVKVEPPGGDGMRWKVRQPQWPDDVTPIDPIFELANRGKRGVALDLSADDGIDIVHRLVRDADIFLTNLTPGRAARYRLGRDDIREVKESLVYATVTGAGTSSPDPDELAFDLTAFFARGGVMGVVGEPGDVPHVFRPGQGDHTTGLALTTAVLAALRLVERTGEFQFVETSLFRTAAWTLGADLAAVLIDGRQPSKRGRSEPISPMNTRYRCRDGVWLNVNAHIQTIWPEFCRALGQEQLIDDPRFDSLVNRFRNGPEAVAIFDEVFGQLDADDAASRLRAIGVPFARVQSLPEVIADPAAEAAGMWVDLDHPAAGAIRTMAAPFTIEGADVSVRGVAPDTGAHSAEVLESLGLTQDEIADLVERGVVHGTGER